MNFICLLFYFFHVANRTLKVACVARVIFGGGGRLMERQALLASVPILNMVP